MAIHSVLLHGETPQAEEPGRLQSMGSSRVGHDRVIQHNNKQSKGLLHGHVSVAEIINQAFFFFFNLVILAISNN